MAFGKSSQSIVSGLIELARHGDSCLQISIFFRLGWSLTHKLPQVETYPLAELVLFLSDIILNNANF